MARSMSTDERRIVKPLSPEELRWLRRLESVLRDMPDRLLIMECADALSLIDRAAAKTLEIEDGKARQAGIVLADIKHGFLKVTGVSG